MPEIADHAEEIELAEEARRVRGTEQARPAPIQSRREEDAGGWVLWRAQHCPK